MAITNTKTGEIRAIGCVLYVRGTFRCDTSMDEVLIWHPDTKTVSTEYIMGDTWAKVDASQETKDAYYKMVQDHAAHLETVNAERKLKSLREGCRVKVVKGRKVPIGTIARVSRIIETSAYTMLILDNGLKTYDQNVLVEYQGEYIEPMIYIESSFFFQAI